MSLSVNAVIIEQEMKWLASVLSIRLKDVFGSENILNTSNELADPVDIDISDSYYAQFVKKYKLDLKERMAILLALATEIKPHLLDVFFHRDKTYDKYFTEFGGITNNCSACFIPTVQTALFVLAGNDLEQRLKHIALFDRDNKLYKNNILEYSVVKKEEPLLSARLCLSKSALSYILNGKDIRYEPRADFSANELTTLMEWQDLVLSQLLVLLA